MKPTVFNHQQYTDLEADYMILKAENEQLKAQLSTTNKRLEAAVECLNVLEPCEFCMYYDENCICARPLDCGNCFEWRGLKGEAP